MKKYIPTIFIIIVIVIFLFTIRDALLGTLTGTFTTHKVPDEYYQLEQLLYDQPTFSRTLWIPSVEKFVFYNEKHPAVSSLGFFNKTSLQDVLNELKKPQTEKKLQEASIHYVVLPFDSDKEIFINDRKYDDNLYKKAVHELQTISYLKEVEGFGKIHVFEVTNLKDHFWLISSRGIVAYRSINPTEYKINLSNIQKGDTLVFSDSFDTHWGAKAQGVKKTIMSKLYNKTFNSFELTREGNYEVSIFYSPQKWIDFSSLISFITLVTCVSMLIFISSRRKK